MLHMPYYSIQKVSVLVTTFPTSDVLVTWEFDILYIVETTVTNSFKFIIQQG